MTVNIRKAVATGVLLGSMAITAPLATAQVNDALKDLGGKVISTHDEVISEIGGETAGDDAQYEDTIVEETQYVTAPVEDYLPAVQAQEPVAPPVQQYVEPQEQTYTSGYDSSYDNSYTESSNYTQASPSTTWYASPTLANTGAAVISVIIVAGLAALLGIVGMILGNRKRKNKVETSTDTE